MKVIRTFHPVGQGAFYTERFYKAGKEKASHNIVYDCGTSWGTITKAQKVVKQAFDKDDVIDYLFISHLDYDHISLAVTLKNSVNRINNIVLPLVARDEIMIGIGLNRIANHEDAVSFLEMIRNPQGNNSFGSDTRIEFVGEPEDNTKNNPQTWKNGESRSFVNIPEWVLIPHNVKSQSRRQELIDALDAVVKEVPFQEEIYKRGLPAVGSGQALFESLKEENFVNAIIGVKKIRYAIKSAYEKVAGGVNENSLLLYSGPAETKTRYQIWPVLPTVLCNWFFRRVACLYTGDSNFDIKEWKDKLYIGVWENVGTIQLPHHGSLKSFDMTNNPLEREYVFPVSCGSVNSYGHPSSKVLSYLAVNYGQPIIVTEMSNSVYIQMIEKI